MSTVVDAEVVWTGCKAASFSAERRLGTDQTPQQLRDTVSAVALARAAMLRSMGEAARLEWERQEALATVSAIRRTLTSNWDATLADHAKRAALSPILTAIAAALSGQTQPAPPIPESSTLELSDVRPPAACFCFSPLRGCLFFFQTL
jgi:hypothetical protein